MDPVNLHDVFALILSVFSVCAVLAYYGRNVLGRLDIFHILMRELKESVERFKIANHQDHEKIFGILDKHSERITRVETRLDLKPSDSSHQGEC